jgi:ABC-type bacteriocin/lantibiotic exporter with double-glycine peptidase domain
MCQVGCLVSSVAMALTGTGHNYNPSTLNAWLKANKGYTNKDDFVWASINTFGLTFEGKIPNSLIRLNLDVGYVLIINVKKGAHWVLATSYNQNTIYVKDSLYNVESYDISEVVSGNSGVYKVPNQFALPVMINDVEELAIASNKANLASEQ